jgi:hypothetical protein
MGQGPPVLSRPGVFGDVIDGPVDPGVGGNDDGKENCGA